VSDVRGNAGGVAFNGGSFTFRNSFVYRNGQAAHVATTGVFAFNTLVGNGIGDTRLSCAGDPRNLTRSIVFSNYAASGTQFEGTCVLANVVTGTASFSGATQLDPSLGETGDFDSTTPEKLAKNQACCLDKLPGGGDAPAVNLLGRARGSSLDIGAFEAP
jgi:hypothetical protein